jgi:hypothetical protein
VLRVAGSDRLYILQAVHEIFEVNPSLYPVRMDKKKVDRNGLNADIEHDCNLFVFIGKNLSEDNLKEMLMGCLINT